MTRDSIAHVSNRPRDDNGAMTSTAAPARIHATWVLTSVIVGLFAGAATLAAQAVLPIEANRLANSGAIWVTVAFAVGWLTPSGPSAAFAGLLTLLAALAGYFAAAAVAQAGISASTVAIWVGVAIVGGPVFGMAGRWRATGSGRHAAVGVALLGAVYVAEGVATLWSVPHMVLAGWVSVLVGIAITALLPRDRDARLAASVLLVPFAAFGVAGYAAIDLVFRSV